MVATENKGLGMIQRTWRFVFIWTLVIFISLSWNLWHVKGEAMKMAENTLRMSSAKDLLFRSWGTAHGGVYVPITDQTRPNPYLSFIEERDINTPTGRQLTLVNPAYMMRQVHEMNWGSYGIQGRLVSHDPINPVNLADEWESQALTTLKAGVDEISHIVKVDGIPIMRYIKPFYVEEGCLLCHAHQGYLVGDLRGGISTQTSLEPYLASYYTSRNFIVTGHGVLWILVAIALFWTAKRLEKATNIIVSEEKFRTIVENTNDAIFLHDLKGNIIDLNDKASALLGYERAELIGQNLSKLRYNNDGETMKVLVKQLLDNGSLVFESSDMHKDGTEIPIEISAKIVSREGNGLIQSFVRDIRKRKQTERELLEANQKLEESIIETKRLAKQAEEANKAKSQFLANMSHEIRTPMNAVLGMTELLEEYSYNEEQRKYIEILKKNGNNLLTIINSILDLSKIEAGKMELEVRETILCNILKEVGDTFRPLAEKKQLQLIVNTEECTPQVCTAIADGDKIRQVLINFVSNAIKFTDSGTVTLSFRIIDHETMRFSVEDTGVGISQDKLENIFHAFNRGDVSSTQMYAGTGLGLTISKKLVELMGGRIWVESERGVGSVFFFELPYQPMDRKTENIGEAINRDIHGEIKGEVNKKQQNDSHSTQTEELVASTRLLVAEDNPDNRQLILAYLKKANVQIDIAENGLQAMEKYTQVRSDENQKPYSLIFMDMQMPIMDGYEATKAIRNWEKKLGYEGIPIYALTAYALNEDRNRSLEAGCTAHITKPVRKNDLLDIINRHREQG